MIEDTQHNTPPSEDVSLDNTVTEPAHKESTPIPPKNHTHEKKENLVFEIFKIVILAIIIVTPIRTFVAQPFIVSGASMDDTFRNGQYLIVDQLSYRFNEPQRGDVVIFRFPLEPSKFFIKRIIGLPHDTVILQGKSTIIIDAEHPDGVVLDEEYILPQNIDTTSFSTTLGDDEYFVMGDNRKASSDSRTWGSLDRKYIIGQAFVRLFPITSFSILPGQ